MPTRKEFCRSCLALALAGAGAPLAFAAAKSDKAAAQAAKRIACCGLACGDCPAYIATRNNDDGLRRETAKKWSAMFKADIKAADINCDGCTSDSERLFSHCRVCDIRACARGKKLANCAHCPDYACEKLAAFLTQVPEARTALDGIRKAM